MTAGGVVRVLASPRDLLLTLRISVMLYLVWLLARFLALPTLLRLLTPRVKKGPPQNIDKTIRYTKSIMRFFPWFSRESCLPRSLLLYRFLKASGYPVSIHFGVNRASGELSGHSWLTLGGNPVAERGDPSQEYTVVYTFPNK